MNASFAKNIKYGFSIFIVIFFFSCTSGEDIKITITNPTDLLITDAFISLDIDSSIKSFTLLNGDNEIPYQVLTEGEQNKICFVLNLNPKETKILTLKEGDQKKEKVFLPRTYAELSMKPGNIYFGGKFHGNKFVNVIKLKVPAIHTDHDALFRYEGPGWESEKVGYRFYLDWRNASDIFGKKVNKLLLSNVGIHDTVAQDDSYHSMQDWGMDIFKVGNSLGIGSTGMWQDGKVYMVSKTDSVFCEIPYNGPIISGVKTSYFGWLVGENKYNLVSELSIAAGSRLTKCEINISDKPNNIVTGLAKYEGTDFIKNNGKGGWAYIALYGKQTLAGPDDKLGIAVLFRSKDLIELTEDELSYVIKLNPLNGKMNYYFCAAWEQEPNGIKNEVQFIKYLDETIEQLDQQPVVETN